MAKSDGFSRDTHKKWEGKRRDEGAGAHTGKARTGARRESSVGTTYSGDALSKGGGTPTFGGRSALLGEGKAPEVSLHMTGNRRTAIAGMGSGKADGASYTGHGPFTRS
jgi:hypothetical protein